MQNERLQTPDDQPDLGSFLTVLVKTGRYGTQWARLEFDTKPDFGKSGIVRLVTQGELIGRIYLVTEMPDIKTQQDKAYYTRKPIKLYSSSYTSINLYSSNGTFTNTVKFTYAGGPFRGTQLDDLIPGGTYSLTISRNIDPPPPISFVAVLSEKPFSANKFTLLSNDTFTVMGLQSATNLYAYSYDGVNWTQVPAFPTITQGVINAIGFNGSYYISGGSSSSGSGLITLENSDLFLNQPVPQSGQVIRAFTSNGSTTLVAGGKTMLYSTDSGVTWSTSDLPTVYGVPIVFDVNSVGWNGTFFFAVGEFASGLFSKTSDPQSWDPPEYPIANQTLKTQLDNTLASLLPIFDSVQNGYLPQWSSSYISLLSSFKQFGKFANNFPSSGNPNNIPIFTQPFSSNGIYKIFENLLSSTYSSSSSVLGTIDNITLFLSSGSVTTFPSYITGTGITPGTYIISGSGPYTINIPHTISNSTTFTIYSPVYNFPDVIIPFLDTLETNLTSLSYSLNLNTLFLSILSAISSSTSSNLNNPNLTPAISTINDLYTLLQTMGSGNSSPAKDLIQTILQNIMSSTDYNNTIVYSLIVLNVTQGLFSASLNAPATPISFQGTISNFLLTPTTPVYLSVGASITGGSLTNAIITKMNVSYNVTDAYDQNISYLQLSGSFSTTIESQTFYFNGTITNSILTVDNTFLGGIQNSVTFPLSISFISNNTEYKIQSIRPITYSVNTDSCIPNSSFTSTKLAGLSTLLTSTSPLKTAITALRTIISSFPPPNIDVCDAIPALLYACANIVNATIQVYDYLYTTFYPAHSSVYTIISTLLGKYTNMLPSCNYDSANQRDCLFGGPSPLLSVLIDPNYSYIQSGYAKGIAINGSTIVIVGTFFRDTAENEYAGSIITSLDLGDTWSIPVDPFHIVGDTTPYVANAVVYTGSLWVVTGKWAQGSISFSTDGITWLSPIEPFSMTGTGNAIAFSPSGLVVTGLWTSNTSSGSITVASGNSLDPIWGSYISPSNPLPTSVRSISFFNSLYFLTGSWLSNTNQYSTSIYTSTDSLRWSPALLFPGITDGTCYSICSNGQECIAVGSFSGSPGTILVSNTPSATLWVTPPSGPAGITTGTAYSSIYDPIAKIYLIGGDWSSGQLTISQTSQFPAAVPMENSFTGQINSLLSTGTSYLAGGKFRNGSVYKTIYIITAVSTTLTPSFSCTITSVTIKGIDTSESSCNGIAGNAPLFVAVGSWVLSAGGTGSIATSTNGSVWRAPFHPPGSTSGTATSISWNGSQFIATGTWDNGSVSVSSDGILWSVPTNPPNYSQQPSSSVLNSLTKQWLLAGPYSTGTIIPFSYGISFGLPFHPGSSTSGTGTGITWDSSQSSWIVVGSWSAGTSIGYLSKSTNTTLWTNPSLPSNLSYSGSPILSTATYIYPNTYLGGSFTFNNAPIQRSTNGTSWAIQPLASGMNGISYGITWANATWFALGSFTRTSWGTIERGPIITSKDGITWSTLISIPLTDPIVVAAVATISLKPTDTLTYYVDATLYSMVYNGSIYVATGAINLEPTLNGVPLDNIFLGTLLTSTDGINWRIRMPFPITARFSLGKMVAWNGILFVATGIWIYDSALVKTFLISSTDGINWSASQPFTNAPSDIGNSIAWNGSLWVVGGSFDGNIFSTSTDGITWSTPFTPTGVSHPIQIKSIVWNGSRFIAVGSLNETRTTLISNNGLSWSVSSPTLSSAPSCLCTLRILPFIQTQPFDTSIQATVTTLPNQGGSVLEWKSNPTYGAGTEYFLNPTDLTFTFTATQRTQWLSYGSYYDATDTIQFTLTRLTPEKPPFVTDLVGPHFSWTNSLGHALINSASISIGGENVETIPGTLMEIIDEFQTPLEKVSQMSQFICRAESGFTQSTYGTATTSQRVITPLPFWFSRGDSGCVLPIDALNVDEVRLTISYKPVTSLYYTDSRNPTPANVEGGSLWSLANSPFYYEDPSGAMIPQLEPITSPKKLFSAFPNLTMTSNLNLPNAYLIVEYIYLDKAEANRFRIADLQVPIVQHYTLNPVDTENTTYVRIPLEIPNPTRDIFFFCQRYQAPGFNAHFLASRDLSSYSTPSLLWWPDASGLLTIPKPGFSTRDSEPLRWLALNYSDSLNRYTTENVALFRTLLPCLEQRKAPWINRYYYNLPFGSQNGLTPFSMPVGEANLDKIKRFHLSLGFHGKTGLINDDVVDRYLIRIYGETYNIFRVYGGRGSMMFAY